jgi:hypothetical protein
MAKTMPIPPDPQARTSDDVAASKLLKVQARGANRAAPSKSNPSNGSKVGGAAVSGGARVRGGRA